MSRPLAYGIDFGTTNSVVAVAYDDPREDVLVLGRQQEEYVKSVLYMHRNGNRQIGDEAFRLYMASATSLTRCDKCAIHSCRSRGASGSCSDSRLLREVKSALASPDFDRTSSGRPHFWGAPYSSDELVALVLRQLKRMSDDVVGHDVRRAVVGHPVVFEGAEGPDRRERQSRALERLHAAALAAGFDEVRLIPEPQAAPPWRSLGEGLVVCVDFGGGTFDVMVAEVVRPQSRALALNGVGVGGGHLDTRLFADLVADDLGLHEDYEIGGKTQPFPAWIREDLGSWRGIQRLLRDKDVPRILRDFTSAPGGEKLAWVWDVLYGGQAHRFLQAIEGAKIALSSSETAVVELSWAGRQPQRVTVTRADFERSAQPVIDRCLECVDAALKEANVVASDVRSVVLTGGSSAVPAFRRGLTERFGVERISTLPAFTSVARGLAFYSHGLWRT